MTDPKSFYFISKSALKEGKGHDNDVSTVEYSRSGALETDLFEVGPSISSWFDSLLKPKGYQQISNGKIRKAPTKIEPKVFFANERTFLAWLHMSVTLSSISIAIVAFAEANNFSQVYGLILMPVAIAFCAYSLYMYTKRSHMIKNRHPGPCKFYQEKKGFIIVNDLKCILFT